jgi:EAL domain-containing protein (putative c-di-GMP-specific phosphodiesterase class I)
MGALILARQQSKADLRRAIDDNQLVVHYQPMVDLSTSLVTGAEALVRWQRPGHGMVPPGDFIELAEQTGLIVPLGERVLDQACGQVQRWRSQGYALGVAVNISTRQLSEHPPRRMHPRTGIRIGQRLAHPVDQASVLGQLPAACPHRHATRHRHRPR